MDGRRRGVKGHVRMNIYQGLYSGDDQNERFNTNRSGDAERKTL